jgi:Zn-dependent protease
MSAADGRPFSIFDLTPALPHRTCGRCGTELPPDALACPSCTALVHSKRLQELAALAEQATREDNREMARQHWESAMALLPSHSEQHRVIREKIAALGAPATITTTTGAPSTTPGARPWWKRGVGIAITIVLLLAGKLKFLLLGLTKLGTVASMFGFIAVYWSLHGWPLAVGLGVSIYIHEMGHVSMLRRLGIKANAPLFIPGVGAFVMLKERVTDPVADARIGLAGPVWGLAAAVGAWAVFKATGAHIWMAIAELTAFLNLFNLIPIWQLDGSRGFHALSTSERWIVAAVLGLALGLTGQGVLWIVLAVAIFRAVKDAPGPGHRPTLATFTVLVLALSWIARAVAQ